MQIGKPPVVKPRTFHSMLYRLRATCAIGLEQTCGALPRFTSDRRANVAMIFAIVSIPILFAVGMAIDYTSAARRRTKLDAAADAAALAAVTPTEMSQTAQAAQLVAQNTFDSLSGTVSGISSLNRSITLTPSSGISSTRTAVVTYSAQSQNAFGGIIGKAALGIGGHSTAVVSTAPNIDFYVLADSSPSMAIPASQAGINAMYQATMNSPSTGGNEGGCAFACHESNPVSDNLGNPGCTGTNTSNCEDNYAVAKAMNPPLELRIDVLRTAIQQLAKTASDASTTNGASYRMAISTFDANTGNQYSELHSIVSLTSDLDTDSSSASTLAGNISMLEVDYNNDILVNQQGQVVTTPGKGVTVVGNSDQDTDADDALTDINTQPQSGSQNYALAQTFYIPNPGNGTGATNDKPQEVLFIITDGIEDSSVGGKRTYTMNLSAACTAIKNRGIRIAVLYTTYVPLPEFNGDGSESWYYSQGINQIQPTIGSTLQQCASTGLYTQVNVDADIPSALTSLFQTAVATAHLTQ
jgi:Flp pilus assembly protein TadG